MNNVISGTYVNIETVKDILAQIAFSEEELGKGVKENRQAINYFLDLLKTPDSDKEFWKAVEEKKLILKGLFEEEK